VRVCKFVCVRVCVSATEGRAFWSVCLDVLVV
jgi:hypothetical protein